MLYLLLELKTLNCIAKIKIFEEEKTQSYLGPYIQK